MSDRLQQIAERFFEKGAFLTIKTMLDQKQLSDREAVAWTKMVFDSYERMVTEAKKEVRHLSSVLSRLDDVCRAVKDIPGSRPWASSVPQIQRLANEVTTFDNWVMSIYETDLSMIALARPDRALAKPGEMAKSFAALRQKRLEAMKFSLKDPSLFKIG